MTPFTIVSKILWSKENVEDDYFEPLNKETEENTKRCKDHSRWRVGGQYCENSHPNKRKPNPNPVILCVWMFCLHRCLYITSMPGIHNCQNRASHLRPGAIDGCECPVRARDWVWVTWRASSALNFWDICPVPKTQPQVHVGAQKTPGSQSNLEQREYGWRYQCGWFQVTLEA